MMYLIIGAYLIAVAVKESGLGERIAYKFIVKYVSSFKSIIVSIFALTFILALLIPHPWPARFSHYVGHGCCGKSADHSPVKTRLRSVLLFLRLLSRFP